ncbi:MAG: PTS sugar transporter subunit IIC [Lactobacillales bacterium]|nr:PTS sugar transporter subunit IIC [Lactobacillales bacterium]
MAAKEYLNKVLTGTATGITVALIPNAILAEIFKVFMGRFPIFGTALNVVMVMQFATPMIVGVLVGLQFKLNPMQCTLVGTAAFLASGAFTVTDGKVALVGIGDLINVMLVSALAVFVTRAIGNKMGSLTILLSPILIGAGVGFVGLLLLPYVRLVTVWIGDMVNSFTTLQPFFMSVLICITFSILIISPISTVAIGIAIGVAGLGAGAAAVGVAACTAILVIGSIRTNEKGVTIAVLLGAMKMMIPNLIKYPILAVPVVLDAIISGIGVYFLNIIGTPASAGFGIVGLVGPISAINNGTGSTIENVIAAVTAFIIIPFVAGILIDFICRKVLKLYNNEIFRFIEG